VQHPTLTNDHIDLFNRYHADMTQRKGWRETATNPQEYFESFLCGRYDFEREFLYFADDTLVAVGLVDITNRSASSVYFFHDPAWRENALGVFSMISELRYLKQVGASYHYLGYWIELCASMVYKSRYRPHQVLAEYVEDDESPIWRDIDANPASCVNKRAPNG
jgi:arginine-tRNA-protein transferase